MLRALATVTASLALGSGCAAAPTARIASSSVVYGNAMSLEVHERSGDQSGDVVVLAVHGCCGDRRDLMAVGHALAERGAIVVNADVHAFGDGGGWPTTYLDAVCAFSWTQRLAEDLGADAAVLGWGDGALVLSAIALGWSELAPLASGCEAAPPAVGPELVIGLAGHYGWVGDPPIVTSRLVEWFGAPPDVDATAWSWGNPGWWLEQRSAARPRFVLVAGAADEDAIGFGDALARRGMAADVIAVEDADHLSVIQPRAGAGVEVLDSVAGALGLGNSPASRAASE